MFKPNEKLVCIVGGCKHVHNKVFFSHFTSAIDKFENNCWVDKILPHASRNDDMWQFEPYFIIHYYNQDAISNQ